MLRAALDPDDQEASQEIGKYLLAQGVDGIIFPSVLGGGTNLVVPHHPLIFSIETGY
jgi:hypothetical protein